MMYRICDLSLLFPLNRLLICTVFGSIVSFIIGLELYLCKKAATIQCQTRSSLLLLLAVP